MIINYLTKNQIDVLEAILSLIQHKIANNSWCIFENNPESTFLTIRMRKYTKDDILINIEQSLPNIFKLDIKTIEGRFIFTVNSEHEIEKRLYSQICVILDSYTVSCLKTFISACS